ncbi:phosphopantetheine-binding protein [Congregibacter brevis]|uniref:Phosphopantetheine-binding protein n=1 Tax=Congregibacter brevis TaxID=3081201 RepID=A0ABZ0IDQ2_9GAMM|nr:phosphopantetheine-binding protein [Congregibacter sp. IMCC45268]
MIEKGELIALFQDAGIEATVSESDFGKTFKELDMDSLDVFNLLTEVDVVFEVQVPDEDFEIINSLDDLLQYINRGR